MPHHHEIRHLPYTATQMFALVADVAKYPEFLPWTAAARIKSRRAVAAGEELEAELVISFKVFREKFLSRVTLLPDQGRILTEYLDGPFKHLKSIWQFRDLPDGGPVGGVEVAFTVDFEFRNPILAALIGLVFNEAMTRVVRAFEARAARLYGRA